MGGKMNMQILVLIALGAFLALLIYTIYEQTNTNKEMQSSIDSVNKITTSNGDSISKINEKILEINGFISSQREVNNAIDDVHKAINGTLKSVVSSIETNKNDIRALNERDIIVNMLPSDKPQKMEIINLTKSSKTVSQSRLIDTRQGKVKETISIKKPYDGKGFKKKTHPAILKAHSTLKAMDL